jgi:CRP-like cAMP-binding protein
VETAVKSSEVGDRIRRRRRGIPASALDSVGSLSLFAGCSRSELLKILSLGTTVEVAAGTELVAQGDARREFFVVVHGTARCVVGGCRVAVLGPGDFFGDVAVLNRGPRTATIRAETNMEVLVFSPDEFQRLLTAVPHLSARMLQVEAERLRASNSLIGALNATAPPPGADGAPSVSGESAARGTGERGSAGVAGLRRTGRSGPWLATRPHPARHDGPLTTSGLGGMFPVAGHEGPFPAVGVGGP